LMWLVAISSGLTALWCGRTILWRNPLGFKKKQTKTERVNKGYWMWWCASSVWI